MLIEISIKEINEIHIYKRDNLVLQYLPNEPYLHVIDNLQFYKIYRWNAHSEEMPLYLAWRQA